MVKILIQFCCLSVVLAGTAGAGSVEADQGQPKLRWHADFFDAFERALYERKPLVVYFRTEDCSNCTRKCRQLETGALASDEFNAFAKRAVFLRLDRKQVEADQSMTLLFKTLNIRWFPTVVVLEVREEITETGGIAEKGRIVGVFSANQFIEQFRDILDGGKPKPEQEVERDPRAAIEKYLPIVQHIRQLLDQMKENKSQPVEEDEQDPLSDIEEYIRTGRVPRLPTRGPIQETLSSAQASEH